MLRYSLVPFDSARGQSASEDRVTPRRKRAKSAPAEESRKTPSFLDLRKWLRQSSTPVATHTGKESQKKSQSVVTLFCLLFAAPPLLCPSTLSPSLCGRVLLCLGAGTLVSFVLPICEHVMTSCIVSCAFLCKFLVLCVCVCVCVHANVYKCVNGVCM